MKKVLVTATNYSAFCAEGKQILLDYGCDIIENPYGRPYKKEELRNLIGEVDGVVAGIDEWDEELFQSAHLLKGIARFGVGVDNIDLEAAKDNKIIVVNTPGINTNAVAEQAIGLMLSLIRQIPAHNQKIRQGYWMRTMAHELGSQTVGLLGFGAIARSVAEKLKAFGSRIIAYDKYPNMEKALQFGVQMMDFEQVLRESNIISIHLPAVEETFHIINKETIHIMKDGVFLINTARGTLVDEAALLEGLRSQKIAGVGTDVFEMEPIKPDNPLFEFVQYIATPHISAETYENCEQTGIVTAKALIDIFEGIEPKGRLV